MALAAPDLWFRNVASNLLAIGGNTDTSLKPGAQRA
jgi:hypothetical protein